MNLHDDSASMSGEGRSYTGWSHWCSCCRGGRRLRRRRAVGTTRLYFYKTKNWSNWLPSGYVKIAIEHTPFIVDLCWFTYSKWWFSIVFCMFTRPGSYHSPDSWQAVGLRIASHRGPGSGGQGCCAGCCLWNLSDAGASFILLITNPWYYHKVC